MLPADRLETVRLQLGCNGVGEELNIMNGRGCLQGRVHLWVVEDTKVTAGRQSVKYVELRKAVAGPSTGPLAEVDAVKGRVAVIAELSTGMRIS